MASDDLKKVNADNSIIRVVNNSDKKIMPFKGQVYEALRAECIRSNKLFVDPYFEAIDKNMFYTQPVPTGVTWKRPGEICKEPKFITDTANSADLDQGYLGDCWFIASCAAVVLVPELFANVVPANQAISGPNYAGIFHFRFWYYGQWVDVVIDDRLPVRSDKSLLFCSNKQEPDEFWAALLEKAYAKLCGCYENLDGGSMSEALIDMSGGIEETFEIKNMQNMTQKDEIWQILVKSRQHKSMIGCSIAPNPRMKEARLSNGLVMGHAYTVTKIALIEVNRRDIRLIRLRNPWGNEVEWKGSWSDSSYEWYSVSAEVKSALEYKKLQDGEFWMSYDDFYRNFESIQFCELTPDAFSSELLKKQDPSKAAKLTWKLTAYNGAWVPGSSSGGCGKGNEALFWTNPQFLITLTDVDPNDNEKMATIVISLMQKFTREKRIKNKGQSCEEFLQFRVYRILNSKDADESRRTGKKLYASQLERCGTSGPYINLREVTKRFRVAPGDYLIIPSAYDADISGEFLLRLYTETPLLEHQCSILHDHKEDLCERDVFFNNVPNVDDKFGVWSSLLGSSSDDQATPKVQLVKSNPLSSSNSSTLSAKFRSKLFIYDSKPQIRNSPFEKIDVSRIQKVITRSF